MSNDKRKVTYPIKYSLSRGQFRIQRGKESGGSAPRFILCR